MFPLTRIESHRGCDTDDDDKIAMILSRITVNCIAITFYCDVAFWRHIIINNVTSKSYKIFVKILLKSNTVLFLLNFLVFKMFRFCWDHSVLPRHRTTPNILSCKMQGSRIMQLSIEAIVFHRDDGVEARKFNRLDRARFNTIRQLGEGGNTRGVRGAWKSRVNCGRRSATRKKRSPRRMGGRPCCSRSVKLFNALAPYLSTPCVSSLARVLTVPGILTRRRITVPRSPALRYALIHYSYIAKTRLATWVHASCRGENSKIRPLLLSPPLFYARSVTLLTNGLCLYHCWDKNAMKEIYQKERWKRYI